jgi:Protein of unknown function (DUF2752)
MFRLDVFRKFRLRTAVRWFLRAAAMGGFAGYCVWNVYWLAHGSLPPSIFVAVTGFPAPTTGGTRAVVHLWRGDVRESLRYNAMAIPILLLVAFTLGWLLRQAATRRRLLLPWSFFWAWAALLAVAWVLKLTGDPLYW